MPAPKLSLKELQELPSWDWPEDTTGRLLEVLRAPSAAEEELVDALSMAGDFVVINDDLVSSLLKLLGDGTKSELVRGTAATALGPALEQAHTDGFDEPDDVPISKATFDLVVDAMRIVFADASVPKFVRRRVLEGAVRAPQDWHKEAVRVAWTSGDQEWRLTAVFCMGYVRGFDHLILEALKDKNRDIRYEAVRAAGEWSIGAAWPVVSSIVATPGADKQLLLAAIDAVASIRPNEAPALLLELSDSSDEDIAAAVEEALALAEGMADEEGFGDEDDEEEDEAPLH